jgi:plastocyanin
MRHVFHTLLLLVSPMVVAAPFNLQFVGVDGKPVDGGVVVTLRNTDATHAVAKPVPAVMDQVARQFAPHVLVIPVGSAVSFPNSDSVSHQVYSFSPAKTFKLKLYQGKPYSPEVFGRAGIVTLGCNIHDQMRAYVYVVEAQYYGRAGHDGRWSAPNVEPGEYTLTIWHPLSRSQAPVLEQKVSIRAENNAPLIVRAATPLKLRSESQVPANWDVY